MKLTLQEWTIQELAAQVALVLSRLTVGQLSRRVSETPTPRTIRYYTRRGLLDPPMRFRGRTALYGNRHLAQLVAVKRLQASGYSLEQIQRRLVGLDETSLKRITGMEATPRQPRAAEEPASAGAITGVRLEERVVLLLEQTSRPPGQDDLAAIRAAAAPLLQLLLARRLLGV